MFYFCIMAKEKKVLEDYKDYLCVVGLDEVGKGCGAGPVVTAAVILPKGFKSELIRDSKKLTDKQKAEVYKLIIDNTISFSCNASTIRDINDLGINKATFKTMHKCIDELTIKPDYILIDGNVWEGYNGNNSAPFSLITKGDDTYTCIAAASIIAKVRRDEYMQRLHELFPNYKWGSNKGYLTADHIEAIKIFGPTKYHRTQYIKNFIG
jgi:ribonuclease HII